MDKEQSVNPGLVICPPPSLSMTACVIWESILLAWLLSRLMSIFLRSENAAKQAFPSRWIRSKICDGCKRNPPTNKQQQFNNLL